MKVKVKPDENGQYYVEYLGVRYNVTNKLKDGRYTFTTAGHEVECVAVEPKQPKPKQYERKAKA